MDRVGAARRLKDEVRKVFEEGSRRVKSDQRQRMKVIQEADLTSDSGSPAVPTTIRGSR